MAEIFHGSIVNITVNGLELVCNTEATLTLTRNTTENPVCKPLSTEAFSQGGWSTSSVTNITWEITGTNQMVADAAASGTMTDADIIDLFINNPNVTVTFQTTVTTNYSYATVRVFEGEGILTGITSTASSEENGTTDFTITGNGQPTWTVEPFTS